MKNYYLIITFVVLFIYGCGTKTTTTTKNTTETEKEIVTENKTSEVVSDDLSKGLTDADKEAIKKTMNEISAIFASKDSKKLKEYFYFGNQFMFVSNPGAFLIAGMSENLDPMYFESLQFKNPVIKFEPWAEMDIDTEGWTKTGCFAEVSTPTDYFGTICQNMIDYELGADDATVAKAKEIDKIEGVRILFTDNYLRFFMTKKNGKWLILAIDIHDFSA